MKDSKKPVQLLINGFQVGGDKMTVRAACLLAGEIRAAFHTPPVGSSTQIIVDNSHVQTYRAKDSGNGEVFWMSNS